jgi:hypothetical protein
MAAWCLSAALKSTLQQLIDTHGMPYQAAWVPRPGCRLAESRPDYNTHVGDQGLQRRGWQFMAARDNQVILRVLCDRVVSHLPACCTAGLGYGFIRRPLSLVFLVWTVPRVACRHRKINGTSHGLLRATQLISAFTRLSCHGRALEPPWACQPPTWPPRNARRGLPGNHAQPHKTGRSKERVAFTWCTTA